MVNFETAPTELFHSSATVEHTPVVVSEPPQGSTPGLLDLAGPLAPPPTQGGAEAASAATQPDLRSGSAYSEGSFQAHRTLASDWAQPTFAPLSDSHRAKVEALGFPADPLPDAAALRGKSRSVRARIRHSAVCKKWANEAVVTISELSALP